MALDKLFYYPLADAGPKIADKYAAELLERIQNVSAEFAAKLEQGKLVILDIGGGEGLLADRLNSLGNKIVSLDGRSFENDNKMRVVADAHVLPFENNAFDLVITLGTTDFDKNPFNNTRKILDEVHRVLKQNGLFVDLYASKDGTSYKDYLKHIAQLTDPEIEEIFRGKFEEKQHNVLVKV